MAGGLPWDTGGQATAAPAARRSPGNCWVSGMLQQAHTHCWAAKAPPGLWEATNITLPPVSALNEHDANICRTIVCHKTSLQPGIGVLIPHSLQAAFLLGMFIPIWGLGTVEQQLGVVPWLPNVCRPHHQYIDGFILQYCKSSRCRIDEGNSASYIFPFLSLCECQNCLLDDVQRKSLLVTGQGPSPGQCSSYWGPQTYNQFPCPPRARSCPISNQKSAFLHLLTP